MEEKQILLDIVLKHNKELYDSRKELIEIIKQEKYRENKNILLKDKEKKENQLDILSVILAEYYNKLIENDLYLKNKKEV